MEKPSLLDDLLPRWLRRSQFSSFPDKGSWLSHFFKHCKGCRRQDKKSMTYPACSRFKGKRTDWYEEKV